MYKAQWDSGSSPPRFKYASGPNTGNDVVNAPSVRAPLLDAIYLVLNTGSLTNPDMGWHWIQPSSGSPGVYVDRTLQLQIYTATLEPKLSLDVIITTGRGGPENERTPELLHMPGGNHQWFAFPIFGEGITLPNPPYSAPPTTAARGLIHIQAGAAAARPNRGNIMLAIGGLYQRDLACWPGQSYLNNRIEELETVSGFSGGPSWSVALTFIRPVMSQTVGGTGKTVSGFICTVFCDLPTETYIYVQWYTDNRLDVICTRNAEVQATIPLDVGYWFRTWPLVLILSYDAENGRIEATVLSCHKGLVSGDDAFVPAGAPFEVRWGNEKGGDVYNLIICGAAFMDQYMDQAAREGALANLEFLDPPP